MPRLSSMDSALCKASCLLMPFSCVLSVSIKCSPMEKKGLSEVSGSWKIMAILEPRKSQEFVLFHTTRCPCPGRWIFPPAIRPRRPEEPKDGKTRCGLAASGLTHQTHDLTMLQFQAHPIYRPDCADVDGELDVEVQNIQVRFRRCSSDLSLQKPWIQDLGKAFTQHGEAECQHGDHHTRKGDKPPDSRRKVLLYPLPGPCPNPQWKAANQDRGR